MEESANAKVFILYKEESVSKRKNNTMNPAAKEYPKKYEVGLTGFEKIKSLAPLLKSSTAKDIKEEGIKNINTKGT